MLLLFMHNYLPSPNMIIIIFETTLPTIISNEKI